jgi:DNA-binding transcriptional LysR family regulator
VRSTTPAVVPLVASFSSQSKDVPETVTPQYCGQHPLLLEYARAQVKLILEWLRVDGIEPRPAIEIENPEAVKRAVAAGLGASIVPDGFAAVRLIGELEATFRRCPRQLRAFALAGFVRIMTTC